MQAEGFEDHKYSKRQVHPENAPPFYLTAEASESIETIDPHVNSEFVIMLCSVLQGFMKP